MTGLDALVQAAMAAPTDRREAALLLLQGHTPRVEPFLSLVGLSRATGISVSTLARWQPPSHELGGRPRYRVSEVLDYLASEEFQRRAAALRAERRAANISRHKPLPSKERTSLAMTTRDYRQAVTTANP